MIPNGKKEVPNNSPYLYKIYDTREYSKVYKEAVNRIVAFKKRSPFDAIVFTGTSGAALAYPLSLTLDIPLVCIRKSGESNHNSNEFEGCTSFKKYIIVDDFISTGSTMTTIKEAVYKKKPQAKLVGIYLFSPTSNSSHWKNVRIIKPW